MCAGSFIALEMCNQIKEARESVGRLILLDPPAAPPTIKDERAQAKAKRSEARQWPGLVKARLWSLFNNDRHIKRFSRTAKRQQKMRRMRDNLPTRLAEMHWILPEQRPYSDETLANVAEQLRLALDAHVPRPYSGKAAILLNSTKVNKVLGESTFWQTHVGGIDHQVCGTDHHEVFRVKMIETARFVSRSLRQEESGNTSTAEKKQAK
jgi:thioesterase domain-containing protein